MLPLCKVINVQVENNVPCQSVIKNLIETKTKKDQVSKTVSLICTDSYRCSIITITDKRQQLTVTSRTDKHQTP